MGYFYGYFENPALESCLQFIAQPVMQLFFLLAAIRQLGYSLLYFTNSRLRSGKGFLRPVTESIVQREDPASFSPIRKSHTCLLNNSNHHLS